MSNYELRKRDFNYEKGSQLLTFLTFLWWKDKRTSLQILVQLRRCDCKFVSASEQVDSKLVPCDADFFSFPKKKFVPSDFLFLQTDIVADL